MRSTPLGLAGAAVLCCAFGAAPAQAQSCWSPGASDMTFNAVSPDRVTDTHATLRLTCQSGAAPGFVRYCVYIGNGDPIAGIAPRWMSNYNGSQLAYDLYADAARTQIIGPPPAGGGFPAYSVVAPLPGSYLSTTLTTQIHGRVPAGQTVPAAFAYQSQITNTTVAWAFSTAGVPSSCTAGAVTGTTSFYLGVRATMASGCRISLATDLDFGAVPSLAAPRDGSGTILVRCPAGVPWSIALDDGSHSLAGSRRMRASSGHTVGYELYLDPARTQRWGSAAPAVVTGVGAGESVPQSAPVHGRVPAQSAVPPGTYSDLVTTTLTY